MKPAVAAQLTRELTRTYDAIASEFDATRQNLWEGFEDFLPYVREGDRVLDAGCGNGRLIKLFAGVKNINYTGCDASAGLLTQARKNFPEARFVQGDLTRLPFNDESFDVVFCIAAFHHIPGRTNRQQALGELKRVLKNGGVLVLTNWDRFTLKHMPYLASATLKKILGLSALDFKDILIPWRGTMNRYYHCFTLGELARAVEAEGLILLKNHKVMHGQNRNLVTIAKK